MRKIFSIALIFCVAIAGLRAQVIHTPAIWVAGGYEGLLIPNGSVASHAHGGQFALGADYTLRAGHFLMNIGVGGTFSRTASSLKNFDEVRLENAVDLDGYPFTFVYDIHSRQDAYNGISLQVPLMVGAQFGPIRFLVGGKFLYSAHLSVNQKINMTTYGDYPQFLDPFVDMPEHQFCTDYSRRDPLLNLISAPEEYGSKFQIDAAVTAEFGWRITPEFSNADIWLSVYGDVGMLDHSQYNKTLRPLMLPDAFNDEPPYMLEAPQMGHLLATPAVVDGLSRYLAVGIKLTVGFPFRGESRRAGPCRCVPE